MLKSVLAACALLCVLSLPAQARKPHRSVPPIVKHDAERPFIFNQNPFSGATSLRVTMTRERGRRVLR